MEGIAAVWRRIKHENTLQRGNQFIQVHEDAAGRKMMKNVQQKLV
jgi:hypothetical protein